MAVRPIDANAMLNELRPVNFEAEHSAVLLSDVSRMMREWVERQPTLTQPNEPLTLEELRKIDTVIPLWVHNLSWGQHEPRLMLVRHVTSNYWSCVDFDGFETIKSDDYGSRYLIYRRSPEVEEEI